METVLSQHSKQAFKVARLENVLNVVTGANVEHSNCTDGDIRLVGGESENEGTIEVCYNHVWGTVCSQFWSSLDANVACRQLGFLPGGALLKWYL